MNESEYTWFKPRRGGKNVGVFIAAFMMFPVMGIITIVMGELAAGILVTGFGVLIEAYIITRALAAGRRYGTGRAGVYLKARSAVLEIPWSELESVGVLEQEDLDRFLSDYSQNIRTATGDMNLKQWYRASREKSELTRFTSVVATESQAGRGAVINPSSIKIEISGPAVVLKKKGGVYFLITPEDCRGFASRVRNGGVATLPPEEWSSGYTPVREERLASGGTAGRKGTLKRVLLINGLVVLLGGGGILAWYMTLEPELPETAAVEAYTPNIRSQIIGVWEDENRMFFLIPLKSAANELSPRVSMEAYTSPEPGTRYPSFSRFALEGMIDEYRRALGPAPTGFDRAALEAYLAESTVIAYSDRFSQEDADYEAFYVDAEGLQAYIDQLFGRFRE